MSEVRLVDDWREKWEEKTNDGSTLLHVAETPLGIRGWAMNSYGTWTPHERHLIPKPRPKTFRPWKREEVPVGSVVRGRYTGWAYLILDVLDETASINGTRVKFHELLHDYVLHRTTESGEWLPVEQCPKCGVEE